MRKPRLIESSRCYHLICRLAHREFFLDDDENTRAVELLLRIRLRAQRALPGLKTPKAFSVELTRSNPVVAERVLELLADGPMRPSDRRYSQQHSFKSLLHCANVESPHRSITQFKMPRSLICCHRILSFGYLESCCIDDRPVVIDEIQKLPILLDEVHRFSAIELFVRRLWSGELF